jgi:calcium-dependent protein kinase
MTNVSFAKFSFDFASFNEISNTAKDFISKLLVKETSKRMTAKNALKHEWLFEIEKLKEDPEREIALSLTKTKLKRYVILKRYVSNNLLKSGLESIFFTDLHAKTFFFLNFLLKIIITNIVEDY